MLKLALLRRARMSVRVGELLRMQAGVRFRSNVDSSDVVRFKSPSFLSHPRRARKVVCLPLR